MVGVTDPQALLRERLLRLDLNQFDVVVSLASYTKGKRVPQYARIQMHEGLEREFREIAAFTLGELRERAGLRLLPHLLECVPGGDVIEFIDLTVAPYDLIREQVAELEHPAVGIPPFRQDAAFLQRVRHYAISLYPREGGAEGPICFFRQYQPKRRLGRGWLAAISVDAGYYDRVEPASLFLFDEVVDAIRVGSLLFLLDTGRVNQMFGFHEELIALVDQGVQLLRERVAMEDAGAFAELCKRDSRKAALLQAIVQKSYLTSLDMQRIADFIADRHLKIPLRDGKFVCDAASVWSILHLLNDDFLASHLTGQFYEVSGKRQQ